MAGTGVVTPDKKTRQQSIAGGDVNLGHEPPGDRAVDRPAAHPAEKLGDGLGVVGLEKFILIKFLASRSKRRRVAKLLRIPRLERQLNPPLRVGRDDGADGLLFDLAGDRPAADFSPRIVPADVPRSGCPRTAAGIHSALGRTIPGCLALRNERGPAMPTSEFDRGQDGEIVAHNDTLEPPAAFASTDSLGFGLALLGPLPLALRTQFRQTAPQFLTATLLARHKPAVLSEFIVESVHCQPGLFYGVSRLHLS